MPSIVLASLDNSDGTHCVDVFVREDGSFGFEEFRAEFDGGARWQSLGKYAALTFASGRAAHAVAQEQVGWLSKSESWRW